MIVNAVARARSYLAKRPPAVAGQRGHAATFAAACRLVEFGLSQAEAWPLLLEWNARCQPPWSERELHHKLADAFQRTQPRLEFAPRPARGGALPARPLSPPTPAAPASPAGFRRVRLSWDVLPDLDVGAPQDWQALAELRGLSPAGVALAVRRGLVRFGRWWGRPAWFALDVTLRSAAARRRDGRGWMPGTKAVFLPGSQAGWALGATQLGQARHVLLVEGGPDLLAAHDFLATTGREDAAVVAMLTGACPLPAEAVAALTGRAVTVIPHADPAGQAAGRRWAGQLQPAAAVRVLSLAGINRPDGPPAKDLNDLAAAVAAGHPAAARCAASLFQP